MRKPSIAKMAAARKTMPSVRGVAAMKMAKPMKAMGQQPMIPGGIAAPMKKGGAAKKPKVGIAIMVAIGKKKGGK